MIRGVHHRIEHDGTAFVEVVGDPETIAAIADDLTSRMLGQPAVVPEPDTRTMDGMADGKGLFPQTLIDARVGTTVWARPFSDERQRRAPVRWRKLDTGRWQCGDASLGRQPGVTSFWLFDHRGPVTFDRPPPEAVRSDDAECVDGTPDDG
jgi:hypothetical protein